MLKKLVVGLLAFGVCASAAAHCFCQGLYIGAQGGWGRADYGDGIEQAIDSLSEQVGNVAVFKDIDDSGWEDGRGYIGYSFLPYLSLEAGFTYFPQARYRANGAGDITTYNFSLRYRTFAVDGVVKLTLPLYYLTSKLEPWSIYGKGGIAYVNSEQSGSYTINAANYEVTQTTQRFRPTFALGIAYNFTDNISMDLSWNTIIGENRMSFNDVMNGTLKTAIPTCNIYTLGMAYKFPSSWF
jgi:opacity protein-like surface antigen